MGCSQLMPSPSLCFRAALEAGAGHTPPSAAHPDGNKRRRGSIASTLGLKKLLSALGHTPRPRPGPSRSYSVEQLQPSALAPHTSPSKVKRAPSLQILHLVGPWGLDHRAWSQWCGLMGCRVDEEARPSHSSEELPESSQPAQGACASSVRATPNSGSHPPPTVLSPLLPASWRVPVLIIL